MSTGLLPVAIAGRVRGGPFDGFDATLVESLGNSVVVRLCVYGRDRDLRLSREQFAVDGDVARATHSARQRVVDDDEYVGDASSAASHRLQIDPALLFHPGATLVGCGSRRGERVVLTTRRVGSLALPTGEVCACDPFAFSPVPPPLAQSVEPGEYPLFLSFANADSATDPPAVAGALVRFHKREVARWARAIPRGAVDATARDLPSPSGHGGLLDAATLREALRDPPPFRERLYSRMNRHGGAYGEAHLVSGSNAWAFRAGRTTTHAAYWGLDAHDAPVCLVIDLGELWEDADKPISFGIPACGSTSRIEHPVLTEARLVVSIDRTRENEIRVRVEGSFDVVRSASLVDAGRSLSAASEPSWEAFDDVDTLGAWLGRGASFMLRAAGALSHSARLVLDVRAGARPMVAVEGA